MKKLQQGEGNEGRLVSGSMWSEDTVEAGQSWRTGVCPTAL